MKGGERMKITVLIENEGNGRLEHEHGLAFHITYNRKQYLLDTGASDGFLQNARELGVHIKNIDAAVLSHAHYDHSGGYKEFFGENKKAQVYLRAEAKRECYAKVWFVKKYIGIPEGVLKTYEHRFSYVEEDCQIDKGVWLIGHATQGLEERGKRSKLYYLADDHLVPDDFAHELSLVFDTEKGLVILNSCSHGGIDNIINEVKDKFPGRDVQAVLGGFHLMGLRGAKTLGVTKENVQTLAETLKYQNVEKIYTGHCTGKPAFKIMKEILGEKLYSLDTGTIIEI